ncbi:MAG: ABC transporter substrate-binding protein [Planctomycetota bacterium]|nr:ABC transporter substrate-binding protein [Planctomycetota bacterium]
MRFLICKIAAVVFAACFILCVAAPALAEGGDKVRIQLNWFPEPEFGGIYAAEQAGIFKKHGLDVQILKGGPSVPSTQMTAAGTVEFGVAAADEVITLRSKDADIVAVYTKYFRKTYGMSGVKVAPYGSGAMAQFLDPAKNDVAMQCFVFSEPLTARKQGIDPKVMLIADTGFNPYTGVIITRGDYLKKNPDVCKRFALALREGWQAYLDNPEPANDVMAKLNTAMDRKTFTDAAAAQKSLVESADTKKSGLGTMTMERWKTLSDQLHDLGIVSEKIPAAACFANP